MKLKYGLILLCCLCMPMFGCVIEAPVNENDDPPTELGCNLDASLCSAEQICVVVDRCGSSCDDDDAACPDVCVEVFGCVSPNSEHAPCRPERDHCGTGLSCQQELEAPCESSVCDGDICTADCMPVYTCQPSVVRSCDPTMGSTQCNEGEVCGIEKFVGAECTPDGGCPAVLPDAVFGCVRPLSKGQQCDQMRTDYGYDQCANGLVCTIVSKPCMEVCDDEGECEGLCEPTPLPTCEPEPVRICDPAQDSNPCQDGKVCGIVSFVGPDCTPDGDCPAVEPAPVFACMSPLPEGEQCDPITTAFGFDQCAEGLICTSAPNPCVEICYENGDCELLCEPTPMPTCEIESVD